MTHKEVTVKSAVAVKPHVTVFANADSANATRANDTRALHEAFARLHSYFFGSAVPLPPTNFQSRQDSSAMLDS